MDRTLSLSVRFAALDKLTAPLRQMAGGARGAAKELAATKREVLQLERSTSKLGGFKDLQRELGDTHGKLDLAKRSLKELQAQIDMVDRPTAKMTSELRAAEREVDRLGKTAAAQSMKLDKLGGELREAGVDVTQLTREEDRLRASLERTNATLEEQKRRVDRVNRTRATGEKMQSVGGKMAGTGAVASATVTAPLVAIGGAATRAFLDFNAQMANVSTLVDTSRESMKAMGDDVVSISKRVPVALADLAAGLYDIRSAGIPAADAMSVLENSGKLAVAGLGTTAEAADLATSAINSFGLKGAEQQRLYDLVFKAVKNGKTTISGLAQGFGAVAGTIASANVPLDEYLASVAALTTTGMPAAQSHTQLRAVVSGLTRDSKELSAVLDKLGAKNLKDLIAKSGGLVPALGRIRGAVGGNDAAMLKLLGSTEALNAAIALTGNQAGVYKSTLEDMRHGGNAIDPAYAKQLEQDSKKFQLMSNRLQASSVKIGAVVVPVIERLGEIATSLADRFDKLDPSTQKAVITGIALAAAFGPVMLILGGVFGAAGTLLKVLGPLFITMGSGRAKAGLLGRAVGFLSGGLVRLAKFVGPLASRAVLALAQGVVRAGAMMLANPMVLAIVAIGLAVGLLAYLVYSNWAKINAAFKAGAAWVGAQLEAVRARFSGLMDWLRTMGSGMAAIGTNLVRGLINGIGSMFGALKAKIQALGKNAVGWFKNVLGIHSPSRVFADLGGHIMGGLTLGLDRGAEGPLRRIRAAGRGLVGAMAATTATAVPVPAAAAQPRAIAAPAAPAPSLSPQRSATAAAASLTIGTIEIRVYQQPGEDAEALARRVREEFDRIRRENDATRRSSFRDDD